MRRRLAVSVAAFVIGPQPVLTVTEDADVAVMVGAAVILQDPIFQFGVPTATFDYGQQIVFSQPITLGAAADRVEILIDYPGALGPNVSEVTAATHSGAQTLTYTLKMAVVHVLPNTPLTAHWRVYAGSTVDTGPDVALKYTDTGFRWRTQTGTLVTIHWYDGDASFGTRALGIAEAGVRNAETELGVTETKPIDFFVYADQTAFYAALGPGTPENVGGEEHSEIRTMFALITPDEVDASWVQEVLPHELTHLVFNTAVDNPYHFPPRWLNEGLAVYLSRGYDTDDKDQVSAAAKDGSLTPLDGLTGNFPTTRDKFFLAYAESVSAVDFMVRTYGKPALVSLIKSYAKGLTDDEAFTASLKVDTAGFTTAWLAALKAKTPVKVGPVAAPAGPLPSGWGGTQQLGNAAGSPAASSGAGSPGVGNPPGDSGGDGTGSVLLVLGVVALLVIGGVVLVVRRGRALRGLDP